MAWNNAGGGGGGNGSEGTAGASKKGGNGGPGGDYSSSDLFGTTYGASGWFAGGGGGASPYYTSGTASAGGGVGGAGADGTSATANTGGGGGGGGDEGSNKNGGNGGSGIVIFKYTTYTLAASAGSGGTVAAPGVGTYTYMKDTKAYINATANSCYHFVNWTGTGGTITDANAPNTTITMTADSTVTANFAINTSTLTLATNNSAGGTPSFSGGSGPFNCGTNATLLANTNSCYTFVSWTATAGASNLTIFTPNAQTTNVMVNGTGTVQANYAINTSTLTTTVAPAGAITAGCTVTNNTSNPHNCGSVVQLTANTVAGWTFSSWSGGGLSGSANPTTLTMDADKSVTATFTPSNSAPTITSITLQNSGKSSEVFAMTPQTAYNVEIVAGDADTINDINQIDIWIFRDDNAGDDGSPAGAWDADHEAIYRWAKSGSTWSMQNGAATTTWSITTGSCDTPGNMAATSGEWNLYFTVGKLAQESDGSTAEWDIKVTVTDSVSNTVSSTIYSKSMGAYSSLSLSSATISFGNIALGGTAAIQTPVSHYVTLQAIANDAFTLGTKSGATWVNGAVNANLDVDGSPAATYFSLTQDNAGDGSGHPTTPQYVTTSTITITDLGAVSRTATAAGANEATTDTNIYMDCILGTSGLKVVTYSGTITFTITNS